ncbi:hypothetical protein AA101099_1776 [Neoasaia chiangmaiensis NBRC 101099]|uniref:Uncharacterized protein n=1 Tax=Neoasaia chiangmaiensis TaxID=320497 RepID=A0A1U9KR16_9PROT|nr:hypothetical protein [Neoasaia chiangmaiensis]AQS88268.1 hypothetical protein A0U93_10310 [Neoasaia chiangmaiensis]GBR39690.1 hypothetical protein AA101099_1776 [Neoasaia chiangmaiensis NBRC 101099]GEN14698.1 hypothetical protein NCH01_11290 [Neoasaia chiangmaiensis]
MTLYRSDLREMAAQALRDADTLAGENVFTARSWPVTPAALPTIQLQVPEDDGESMGRSAQGFTRVANLAIRAKVLGGTPEKAELTAEVIGEQIEMALMCSAALQEAIQQVTHLRSSLVIDSSGRNHIAELRILMGLEYSEYFPPPGTPLAEIKGQMQAEGNPDFADMAVPFPQN